ncbi:hypothetical protein OOU_Y34scaffold00165g3 [Pyricularia oryzae Y34]|uniref:Uncharacterized protein n=2 Tax=Pyricularia oryzae TaxID=318829 RepID=A0AA97P739_PYRO3|nr:hypothetical protein OOU_Y34scaffold00165g3 [Pyricularia oryzae Y34]
MGRLVCWIETAKNLMEILRQKCPPLDSGYNEAARKRYTKLPNDVSPGDLYDFVEASSTGSDILQPLRDAESWDQGS